MIEQIVGDLQFLTDGRTLWINSPQVLIGRFSPMGVDVHSEGTCASCKTGDPDWDQFVRLMAEVHAVTVPGGLRPEWSRNH